MWLHNSREERRSGRISSLLISVLDDDLLINKVLRLERHDDDVVLNSGVGRDDGELCEHRALANLELVRWERVSVIELYLKKGKLTNNKKSGESLNIH